MQLLLFSRILLSVPALAVSCLLVHLNLGPQQAISITTQQQQQELQAPPCSSYSSEQGTVGVIAPGGSTIPTLPVHLLPCVSARLAWIHALAELRYAHLADTAAVGVTRCTRIYENLS